MFMACVIELHENYRAKTNFCTVVMEVPAEICVQKAGKFPFEHQFGRFDFLHRAVHGCDSTIRLNNGETLR